MKYLLAVSMLAAAVSASPAVAGNVWRLTFHSDNICASDTTGTSIVTTDGTCDSSTMIPADVNSVMACNQDETSERVEFFSDSACTPDDFVAGAAVQSPQTCSCIRFDQAGAVNSAQVFVKT